LALPLPLGVEGLGEWLDLEFVEPVEPAAVREALQRELPAELRLLSVAAVPVNGPSLSQELAAAHWRFRLLPQAGAGDSGAGGLAAGVHSAIATLLAAEHLIWRDTDKKGRARERDCRPYLLSLTSGSDQAGVVVCELEALVDPQGRSLRPEQVMHWLAESMGQPLELAQVQRRSLILSTC
jgi:radical SAM-linked protein